MNQGMTQTRNRILSQPHLHNIHNSIFVLDKTMAWFRELRGSEALSETIEFSAAIRMLLHEIVSGNVDTFTNVQAFLNTSKCERGLQKVVEILYANIKGLTNFEDVVPFFDQVFEKIFSGTLSERETYLMATLLKQVCLNYTLIREKTLPVQFAKNIYRVSDIMNGFCKSVSEPRNPQAMVAGNSTAAPDAGSQAAAQPDAGSQAAAQPGGGPPPPQSPRAERLEQGGRDSSNLTVCLSIMTICAHFLTAAVVKIGTMIFVLCACMLFTSVVIYLQTMPALVTVEKVQTMATKIAIGLFTTLLFSLVSRKGFQWIPVCVGLCVGVSIALLHLWHRKLVEKQER